MLSSEQQREPLERSARPRVKGVLRSDSSVLESIMQRHMSFTNDSKLHRMSSSPPRTHRFRDQSLIEDVRESHREEASTGRWLTWQTYNDDRKLADSATTIDCHHCHPSPTRKIDDDKALFLRGMTEFLTLRICVVIVIVSLMLMVWSRYMTILDELGHLERRYSILVETEGLALVSMLDDTVNNCLEYFVEGMQKNQEGIYEQG